MSSECMRRPLRESRRTALALSSMGATGTGKTSVLNASFKDAVGQIGHGVPCTMDITPYPRTETCPVWIYDTKGFEPLSDNRDIFEGLKKLKEERMAAAMTHDPTSPEYHSERLHAVWWVTDERFERDCAERMHETFGEEIPIFVIVNKCDRDQEEVETILTEVKQQCPWAKACIPVASTPKHGPLRKQCPACHASDISVNERMRWFMCHNGWCCKKGEKQDIQEQYGIQELLENTVVNLPVIVAHSFLVAHRDYLTDLDTKAFQTIIRFTAVACTIGAVSIPFSGSALLWMNHNAMFESLAQIYGLNAPLVTFLSAVCSRAEGAVTGQEETKDDANPKLTALFAMSAEQATCSALTQGLKFIPGVGSLVGGAISATVAAATTFAIGMTVRELLRRVRKLAVFGEVTREHFFQVMGVEEMQTKFLQYLRSFNPLTLVCSSPEDASSEQDEVDPSP